jgi:Zn-dependent M16 (insulinase) family peptidase
MAKTDVSSGGNGGKQGDGAIAWVTRAAQAKERIIMLSVLSRFLSEVPALCVAQLLFLSA